MLTSFLVLALAQAGVGGFRSIEVPTDAKLFGPINESSLAVYSPKQDYDLGRYRVYDSLGRELAPIVRSKEETPVGVDANRQIVFRREVQFTGPTVRIPSTLHTVSGNTSIWTIFDKELAVVALGKDWKQEIDYFVGAADVNKSGTSMVIGEDVDYDIDGTDRNVLHVFSLADKKETRVRLTHKGKPIERLTDDVRFISDKHIVALVAPLGENSFGDLGVTHLPDDTGYVLLKKTWLATVDISSGEANLWASVDIRKPKHLGGLPQNLFVPLPKPSPQIAIRSGNRVYYVPVRTTGDSTISTTSLRQASV